MITPVLLSSAVTAIICGLIGFYLFRKHRLKIATDTVDLIKRLDREVQTADNERNRLLDALTDAFFLVDEHSRIRFANRAARSLFAPREILNRTIDEVFLEPRLTSGVAECVKTGHPRTDQVILSLQSSPLGDQETRGSNAWVVDSAAMPSGDESSPLVRVIVRDTTDAYQTEQIRKDFVANASHELRTPLAIIGGYLENLLEEGGTEDREMTRHFLGIMQKHTERISRIVEDMLVISRLESGEANALNIEPFQLRSCVMDVIERLESVIRTQEAKIAVAIPEDSPMIRGDRFYWTQVLFNLVENSLKQNPQPGLKVEVGCEPIDNGKLRIWVADNGIGIPSADLTHIFRRFYRVEKHHSQQKIKGTGLGLSIVKRAIEAHGGSIHVTSTPGRDTRFVIEV